MSGQASLGYGIIPDFALSELAVSLRVPLVPDPHPKYCYLVSVVVGDDVWGGEYPTEDELRMIASFREEYIERWYNESYKKKMREESFDSDCGYNSIVLIKRDNGGWGYRRSTWTIGPYFVPSWNEPTMDLEAVLDRTHHMDSKHPSREWAQWKKDHPDIFKEKVES